MDSILAQKGCDLEVIVVDDGSTDATRSILEEYRREDGRVRVVHQAFSGLTAALIVGCKAARSEFIARHDADDWSAPDRMRLQAELFVQRSEVGFVTSNVEWISPDGVSLGIREQSGSAEERTAALLDQHVGPPAHGSVMFRRAVYQASGGYRPQFYFAQDIDLWLRLAERSLLDGVSAVLYRHVRDPASISGSARSRQWEFGALAFEAYQLRARAESEAPILERAAILTAGVLQRGDGAHTRRDYALASYNLAAALLERRDPSAARYLFASLRLYPLNWRAWFRLAQTSILAVCGALEARTRAVDGVSSRGFGGESE